MSKQPILPWRTSTPSQATEIHSAKNQLRLLVRSKPLDVENLRGWLSRLSDRNGLSGHLQILRAINLRKEMTHEEIVARLASLCGVARCEVEWIVPRVRTRGVPWLDGIPGYQASGRSYIFRLGAQICPACIAEGRPLHAAWNLAAWTACPFHCCLMLDRCHVCAAFLSHRRQRTFQCSKITCQADLRDAPRILASPTTVRLASLLAHMMGLRGIDLPLNVEGPLNFLDTTGLAYFVHTFVRYFRVTLPSPIQLSDLYKTAAEAAAIALFDWPAGYHAFLQKSQDTSTQSVSLKVEFPRYYHILTADCRSVGQIASTAQILVAEIKRFSNLSRLADPRRAGLISPRNIGVNPSFMSACEAKRALQKSFESIERLIDNGDLIGKSRTVGGRRYIQLSTDYVLGSKKRLSRAEALARFKRNAGVISQKEAAQILGLSGKMVRRLLDDGILEMLRRKEAINVLKSSVDNLIGAFNSRARYAYPGEELIHPFACKHSRIFLSDVIAAVCRGELTPVRVDTARFGLRHFLYERSEVVSYAARQNS